MQKKELLGKKFFIRDEFKGLIGLPEELFGVQHTVEEDMPGKLLTLEEDWEGNVTRENVVECGILLGFSYRLQKSPVNKFFVSIDKTDLV